MGPRQGGRVQRPAGRILRCSRPRAVYAYGAKQSKTMLRPLLQFFIDHVAAVNNAREFEAFCKHFQAVVAFTSSGENR